MAPKIIERDLGIHVSFERALFNPLKFSLQLENVKVNYPNSDKSVLQAQLLMWDFIPASFTPSLANRGKLRIENAELDIWFSHDGSSSVESFIPPASQDAEEDAEKSKFFFALYNLEIRNTKIVLFDKSVDKEQQVYIERALIPLGGQSKGSSSKQNIIASLNNVPFAADLTLDLYSPQLKGDFSLAINTLGLEDYQVYLHSFVPFVVRAGTGNILIDVHVEETEKDLDIELTGELALSELYLESKEEKPLLYTDSLVLQLGSYSSLQKRLHLKNLILHSAFVSLPLGKDGSLDFSQFYSADASKKEKSVSQEASQENNFTFSLDDISINDSGIILAMPPEASHPFVAVYPFELEGGGFSSEGIQPGVFTFSLRSALEKKDSSPLSTKKLNEVKQENTEKQHNEAKSLEPTAHTQDAEILSLTKEAASSATNSSKQEEHVAGQGSTDEAAKVAKRESFVLPQLLEKVLKADIDKFQPYIQALQSSAFVEKLHIQGSYNAQNVLLDGNVYVEKFSLEALNIFSFLSGIYASSGSLSADLVLQLFDSGSAQLEGKMLGEKIKISLKDAEHAGDVSIEEILIDTLKYDKAKNTLLGKTFTLSSPSLTWDLAVAKKEQTEEAVKKTSEEIKSSSQPAVTDKLLAAEKEAGKVDAKDGAEKKNEIAEEEKLKKNIEHSSKKETLPLLIGFDRASIKNGEVLLLENKIKQLHLVKLAVQGTNTNLLGKEKQEAQLQGQLASGGTFTGKLEGLLSPPQASLNLAMQNISVAPFVHAFVPSLPIDINKALLNASLVLNVSQQEVVPLTGETPSLADLMSSYGILLNASGSLSFTDLIAKVGKEPLIKVQKIDAKNITLASKDNAVSIDEIAFTKPEGTLTRFKDGTSSISSIFKDLNTAPLAETREKLDSLIKKEITQQGDAQKQLVASSDEHEISLPLGLHLSTPLITMKEGSFHYIDQTLVQVAHILFTHVNGELRNLNSQSSTLASYSVSGSLNGSPLSLKGHVNPYWSPLQGDLSVSLSKMDMTALSPYAESYLGYPIYHGFLSLEGQLSTGAGLVQAQNALTIDRLRLGPQLTGYRGPSYPIKTALSMLESHSGVIHLSVPFTGSLSDPQFSFVNLVPRLLSGTVLSIVSAPFSIFSSIFIPSASLPEPVNISFAGDSTLLDQGDLNSVQKIATQLAKNKKLFAMIKAVKQKGNANTGTSTAEDIVEEDSSDDSLALKRADSIKAALSRTNASLATRILIDPLLQYDSGANSTSGGSLSIEFRLSGE